MSAWYADSEACSGTLVSMIAREKADLFPEDRGQSALAQLTSFVFNTDHSLFLNLCLLVSFFSPGFLSTSVESL